MTLIVQLKTWLSRAALILVAGCDRGTPLFWPVPAHKVEIQGLLFEVRPLRQSAEAVRITDLWFPKVETVLPLALAAIRSVTGCANITPLAADPSVITARLNCPLVQDP